MNFFVIASLVAAAMAEADPAYFYGGHGLGYAGLGHLGYAGVGHVGYAGLKSAPCVNAANVPVPCAAGPAHYGYGLAHHAIGKREADPALALGYAGLGHLGYAGVGHLGYAGIGHGLGYAGIGHGLGYAHHGVGVVAGHGLNHGVVAGTGVHSSLVGVCTNVHGAQVAC